MFSNVVRRIDLPSGLNFIPAHCTACVCMTWKVANGPFDNGKNNNVRYQIDDSERARGKEKGSERKEEKRKRESEGERELRKELTLS